MEEKGLYPILVLVVVHLVPDGPVEVFLVAAPQNELYPRLEVGHAVEDYVVIVLGEGMRIGCCPI